MSLRIRLIVPLFALLAACATDEGEDVEEAEAEELPLYAVCAMQLDEASCRAIPPEDNDGAYSSCYWEQSFALALVDGVCEFGELSGTCRIQTVGDLGCASSGLVCGEADVAVRYEDGEMTVGGCYASDCQFDDSENGVLLDGPPECECLCDPGAPVEL